MILCFDSPFSLRVCCCVLCLCYWVSYLCCCASCVCVAASHACVFPGHMYLGCCVSCVDRCGRFWSLGSSVLPLCICWEFSIETVRGALSLLLPLSPLHCCCHCCHHCWLSSLKPLAPPLALLLPQPLLLLLLRMLVVISQSAQLRACIRRHN